MHNRTLHKRFGLFTQMSFVFAIPISFAIISQSAQAFEPYQANYNFNIAGLLNGNASRTLSQQDGIWNYTFKASVVSMATASEVSHFRYESSKIQTLDHAYNFKFLNNIKNSSFKIDWPNKVVTASSTKNGDTSYPAQVGALDMLNLELQVREDIKHKQLRPSYLLASEKGITEIQFVNEGEEKVETPAGEYDAVKLRLVQDNEKRKTYFWLAPKLDYLPVRVHQDDGNLSYELNLTSYQATSKTTAGK
ncbi:DUF3108 domain-containing protein [Aquirhabdus parva]|uniref:DUF3108 domain-containing protein n=1 Tax=Aquirhabdus parva TaxID=2283318 RepID=A0A345P5C6_9GAMM|nr:DUF3108 domain-containing protein [Aquirhabdus parva]AXI02485.1 DUF3108 domain-containing protein [Aquirhabdus parva]